MRVSFHRLGPPRIGSPCGAADPRDAQAWAERVREVALPAAHDCGQELEHLSVVAGDDGALTFVLFAHQDAPPGDFRVLLAAAAARLPALAAWRVLS